jgi:hypothetical protein
VSMFIVRFETPTEQSRAGREDSIDRAAVRRRLLAGARLEVR